MIATDSHTVESQPESASEEKLPSTLCDLQHGGAWELCIGHGDGLDPFICC
jgi:hypothetical protein